MSLSQTSAPSGGTSLTDCMPPLVEAIQTCLSHRLTPLVEACLSKTAVPSGGNSDMSFSQTAAPIIIIKACHSHKILPLSGGYSDMSLLYVHMVSCMFISSPTCYTVRFFSNSIFRCSVSQIHNGIT